MSRSRQRNVWNNHVVQLSSHNGGKHVIWLKYLHLSAHRSHLLWQTTALFYAFAFERLCNHIRITESHMVQMPHLANLNSWKDNVSTAFSGMTCFWIQWIWRRKGGRFNNAKNLDKCWGPLFNWRGTFYPLLFNQRVESHAAP